MKRGAALAISAVPVATSAESSRPFWLGARTFGPSGCVSLSVSDAGSCVIETDCDGQDLSEVDFSFQCVQGDGVVAHSFGVGGFDTNEAFDTEVKCEKCVAQSLGDSPEQAAGSKTADPVAAVTKNAATRGGKVVVSLVDVAQEEKTTAATAGPLRQKYLKDLIENALGIGEDKGDQEEKHKDDDGQEKEQDEKQKNVDDSNETEHDEKNEKKAAAEPAEDEDGKENKEGKGKGKDEEGDEGENSSKISYGPDECVSVQRNASSGHCIMETDCKADATKNYTFGLICVNGGMPVKHLFGKDSFDPKEKFDTLIPCDTCFGLEELPYDAYLQGQVEDLAETVKSLRFSMKNLSSNIKKLASAVAKSEKEKTRQKEDSEDKEFDETVADGRNSANEAPETPAGLKPSEGKPRSGEFKSSGSLLASRNHLRGYHRQALLESRYAASARRHRRGHHEIVAGHQHIKRRRHNARRVEEVDEEDQEREAEQQSRSDDDVHTNEDQEQDQTEDDEAEQGENQQERPEKPNQVLDFGNEDQEPQARSPVMKTGFSHRNVEALQETEDEY